MPRLFAEPLPAKLVWDEGELVALVVAGHRHTVVEQVRRWRWKPTGGGDSVSRGRDDSGLRTPRVRCLWGQALGCCGYSG